MNRVEFVGLTLLVFVAFHPYSAMQTQYLGDDGFYTENRNHARVMSRGEEGEKNRETTNRYCEAGPREATQPQNEKEV